MKTNKLVKYSLAEPLDCSFFERLLQLNANSLFVAKFTFLIFSQTSLQQTIGIKCHNNSTEGIVCVIQFLRKTTWIKQREENLHWKQTKKIINLDRSYYRFRKCLLLSVDRMELQLLSAQKMLANMTKITSTSSNAVSMLGTLFARDEANTNLCEGWN